MPGQDNTAEIIIKQADPTVPGQDNTAEIIIKQADPTVPIPYTLWWGSPVRVGRSPQISVCQRRMLQINCCCFVLLPQNSKKPRVTGPSLQRPLTVILLSAKLGYNVPTLLLCRACHSSLLECPAATPLSLAGAATSISFVSTKNVSCRDKSMLVKKLCLSWQNIFVATKLWSQQLFFTTKLCSMIVGISVRDHHNFWSVRDGTQGVRARLVLNRWALMAGRTCLLQQNMSIVTTKVSLSRQQQKFDDKLVFVTTKHVFCRDKSMLVETKPLSRQTCVCR